MKLSHYKQTLRLYGVKAFMLDVFVSVLSRGPRLILEQVHCVGKDDVAVSVLPRDAEVKQISREELELLCKQPEYCLDPRGTLSRLNLGHICIGLFVRSELVAYGWYALSPFEHCHGVEASFSPNFACGYDAFTLPSHRGLGLRSHLVECALRVVSSAGKNGIVIAITSTNFASRRAGQKLGYRPRGWIISFNTNKFGVLTCRSPGVRESGYMLRAIKND